MIGLDSLLYSFRRFGNGGQKSREIIVLNLFGVRSFEMSAQLARLWKLRKYEWNPRHIVLRCDFSYLIRIPHIKIGFLAINLQAERQRKRAL